MNAVLYNGRIHPQYRTGKFPTAMALTGGKIVDIGYATRPLIQKYPRHRRIDLDGRTVLPGFVDSHVHFYFWAATLDTVHLDHTATFDDALNVIKSFVAGSSVGEWIVGDGWSADRWNPYHLPNAAELDAVTGQYPAGLFSKDQHILWVNSKALQMAGIDRQTPDPEGGKIDRDADGNPTGILREIPGYFPVLRLMGKPDQSRMDRMWRKAAQIAYSRGVIGFHSMDGMPTGSSDSASTIISRWRCSIRSLPTK
jgi:predicted amidohydrolase YtcJ